MKEKVLNMGVRINHGTGNVDKAGIRTCLRVSERDHNALDSKIVTMTHMAGAEERKGDQGKTETKHSLRSVRRQKNVPGLHGKRKREKAVQNEFKKKQPMASRKKKKSFKWK